MTQKENIISTILNSYKKYRGEHLIWACEFFLLDKAIIFAKIITNQILYLTFDTKFNS